MLISTHRISVPVRLNHYPEAKRGGANGPIVWLASVAGQLLWITCSGNGVAMHASYAGWQGRGTLPAAMSNEASCGQLKSRFYASVPPSIALR